MAWRRSGLFHPAEEILVVTCDVCERDIGYEDGRRPHEHFASPGSPIRAPSTSRSPCRHLFARVPAGIRGEHAGSRPRSFFAKPRPAAPQAHELTAARTAACANRRQQAV